jgi:hypothetical protein
MLTSPIKERQLQKLAISRCQFHDLALLFITDGRQDCSSEFSPITLSTSRLTVCSALRPLHLLVGGAPRGGAQTNYRPRSSTHAQN